jgi:hypothetical protein
MQPQYTTGAIRNQIGPALLPPAATLAPGQRPVESQAEGRLPGVKRLGPPGV